MNLIHNRTRILNRDRIIKKTSPPRDTYIQDSNVPAFDVSRYLSLNPNLFPYDFINPNDAYLGPRARGYLTKKIQDMADEGQLEIKAKPGYVHKIVNITVPETYADEHRGFLVNNSSEGFILAIARVLYYPAKKKRTPRFVSLVKFAKHLKRR